MTKHIMKAKLLNQNVDHLLRKSRVSSSHWKNTTATSLAIFPLLISQMILIALICLAAFLNASCELTSCHLITLRVVKGRGNADCEEVLTSHFDPRKKNPVNTNELQGKNKESSKLNLGFCWNSKCRHCNRFFLQRRHFWQTNVIPTVRRRHIKG